MTAITWKLGRLKLAEHLLREAARHLPRPLKRELDTFLAGGGGVDPNSRLSPSRGTVRDDNGTASGPDDAPSPRPPTLTDVRCCACGEPVSCPRGRDVLAACDEIAKLQKRAEDWEQKDVASFEKTIADLREKLAAVGSRVYGSRRHWKGRAGRAERELESYAATDLTASLALVDVTRERDELKESCATWKEGCSNRRQERDELQRQLDEALILIEDTASSHLENDQLQSDLDAANAKVERLRELVHQEECCEGTWDSDVDHYGCCEALRCSLGETGGDDGKTQEEADAKWNTRG